MIQKIIDGIIAAIREKYADITVYDEQIKQGLKEPCFIVRSVNPTNELFLKDRYRRTNLFTIQYIPQSTNNAKAECNGVTDVLFGVLEHITIDGVLQRGTSMRAEFLDGVLSFFVNYDMYVCSMTENEPMETITYGNEVAE